MEPPFDAQVVEDLHPFKFHYVQMELIYGPIAFLGYQLFKFHYVQMELSMFLPSQYLAYQSFKFHYVQMEPSDGGSP